MDARSALNAVKWLHTVVWAFWRCPLTDVAARYTTDRAENFDIHLPLWLAKYNKIIFTPLYLLGAAYTMMGWLTAR